MSESLVRNVAPVAKQTTQLTGVIKTIGLLSDVLKGCKVLKMTGENGQFIAYTNTITGVKGTLPLGKKSYGEALADLKIVELENGTRLACRQGSSYSVLEEVTF